MPASLILTSPMPQFPETVADVIRAFRSTLGLSQQALADILHVSKNFISLMEQGRNEPDRATIAAWFTSESDIAHQIAKEIFIVRSRQMLALRRPVPTSSPN